MTSNRKEVARRIAERAARKYLAKAAADQEAAGLVGKTIVFEYPAANYEGVELRYETRLMRVDSVRDFGSDPTDEAAAERNPYLRRIGKLLTGVDLACGRERSFYRGAMRGMHVASEAEVEELAARPATVLLVERPNEWAPSGPRDIPPNVEVHNEPDFQHAAAFADGFNATSMASSAGWWAVAGSRS